MLSHGLLFLVHAAVPLSLLTHVMKDDLRKFRIFPQPQPVRIDNLEKRPDGTFIPAIHHPSMQQGTRPEQ